MAASGLQSVTPSRRPLSASRELVVVQRELVSQFTLACPANEFEYTPISYEMTLMDCQIIEVSTALVVIGADPRFSIEC